MFKRIRDSLRYRSKKILSYFIKGMLFQNVSFSQEGEDILLEELFIGYNKGFYVDVGCFHPWRFSNTAKMYKNGWRGIAIDPNPQVMKLFAKERPRDITVECGISNRFETLNYYCFEEPAENTFNKELAERVKQHSSLKYIKKIPLRPLSDVLEEYKISEVDFLDIDVEGMDFEVIRSFDFQKVSPRIIMFEDASLKSLNDAVNSEIVDYMTQHKYVCICKNIRSLIFQYQGS